MRVHVHVQRPASDEPDVVAPTPDVYTREVWFWVCSTLMKHVPPPPVTATDATELSMNTIEKAKTRKEPVAAANEAERGVAEAATTKVLHSSHQIYS